MKEIELDYLKDRLEKAQAEINRLNGLINSPELCNFSRGVELEAAHQRERWGNDHDAGKEPADWFWLIGYLAGKALNAHLAHDTEKALHHTISTAAALANWHSAILGPHHNMRPGIDGEAALGRSQDSLLDRLALKPVLTDDFCATFSGKDKCVGVMAKFIPDILPAGVNGDDPRVKQIQQWCRENNNGDSA